MQESSLDQYEVVSLKILAILNYSSDLVELDCKTCRKGACTLEKGREYYYDALDLEIDVCPLKCILDGHYSFFDKFLYYDLTKTPLPSYEDCPADFWRLYKRFLGYKNAVLKGK